jgi:hypothetical protein
MDLESIKTGALALVAVGAAALHWWKTYYSVRTAGLRLSSTRARRFNKLVEKDRWRKASPTELESAFAEAFGYRLEDRHIAFALDRHCSLALFSELHRCDGMVRISPDGKRFEHWRGFKYKRWSYRCHARIAFCVGLVPVGLFIIGTFFMAGRFSDRALIAGLALDTFMLCAWAFMALLVSGWFEAAHRVVEEMDMLYPPRKPGGKGVKVRETGEAGGPHLGGEGGAESEHPE